MRKRLLPLALLMLVAAPAWAEHPAECRVAENLTEPNFRLPHVTRAVGAKHLNILVVGAGSSQLPGSSGDRQRLPSAAATGAREPAAGCRCESYNRCEIGTHGGRDG